MSILPFSLNWLISHQPAAAAAYRHDSLGADGVSEFYGGFVVPDVCDGVGFDVADDVIVIIAAEAYIAVAVDFQRHEDADALVISEGIAVIGIVAVDIVARVKLWHHHGWAPSLGSGDVFHLLKFIKDNAVIEIFPGANPAKMGLRLKTEPPLEIHRMFLRGLRIDPPREIEDLRVCVLAGESVEVYHLVDVVLCDAAQRNNVREFLIAAFFLFADSFERRFDILEVVVVLGNARALRVVDVRVGTVNAHVENFAGVENVVCASRDVCGVGHERDWHPPLLDVIQQLY